MEFIGMIIAVIAAVWVYLDGQKRGLSSGKAIAWSIGTLLVLIVVLPLYLIMRPKVGLDPAA